MTDRIPAESGCLLDEFDAARFWSHVTLAGGMAYLDDPLSMLTAEAGECWTWSGWTSGRDGQRYGRINMFGRPTQAHDIGFQEFGGTIPEGMILDHLCRNSLCVRHNHLEPVTTAANIARGRLGRDANPACRNRHPYDEANTRWGTNRGRPVRICLTCLAARREKAAA